VERGEKDVYPSKSNQAWNFPLATKQDVSPLASKHWIHFKGHQAWNLPLATKLGFSVTSFLKVQIWIICFFFFGCDFLFEYLKTCSYNFPWEEKNNKS
jgi:hypothetical protein